MLGKLDSYRLRGNTFWLADIEEENRGLFQNIKQMVLSDCGLRYVILRILHNPMPATAHLIMPDIVFE